MAIFNGTRPALIPEPEIDLASIRQARVFAALSDPIRICILHLLIEYHGGICVQDLLDEVNARLDRFLAQPTISHHLRILRDADLVVAKKRGLYAYYRVVPGALVSAQGMLTAIQREAGA